MKTLNIVGGTYVENCSEPNYNELFGSGFRGAQAISKRGFEIKFHSCINRKHIDIAQYQCKALDIDCYFLDIERTVQWFYYHPLSRPVPVNVPDKNYVMPELEQENILCYGLIEADIKVKGNYVVYDPQNHVRFSDTGSTANHLALILNKKEALLFKETTSNNLEEVGKSLLVSEKAEVVVIKNGSEGALVFHQDKVSVIPVFETEKVWPIGTGDIFSAVFAWKWIIEELSPEESSFEASKYVAHYCQARTLPLNLGTITYKELVANKKAKSIYLAGPFFTIGERHLVNEFRNALIDFGNIVFSPFHDAKILVEDYTKTQAKMIVKEDLEEIKKCDVILAICTGKDIGTSFEIGYGFSLGKKVVVFAENLNDDDLVMLIGSDCEITDDFSTAVYKASW